MATNPVDWRNPNDPARNAECGAACAITSWLPSRTQQQFRTDADINVIAKRFGLDRQPMPVAPIDPAYYGDFTGAPDLRTVLDNVRDAREHFMALPPKLRARFHNKPAELWEFVNDPENADEAVRLGLLARAPAPPAPDSVVPERNENAAPESGETGTSIS